MPETGDERELLEFRKLPTDELQDRVEADSRRLYETELAGRFFLYHPTRYQVDWWKATARTVGIFCANRVGKTEFAAAFGTGAASGWQPYFFSQEVPKSIPDLRGKKILIAADTFKTTIPEVIIPKLNRYLMPEMLAGIPRFTNNGIPMQYDFRSGATIYLRSYEQGRRAFESTDYDLVLLDEPPPYEIYLAISRGLVDRSGRMYITATPIDEPWMRDEILAPALDPDHVRHADVEIFKAGMHDNCRECNAKNGEMGYLAHADIEEFARKLPEDQKAARLYGEFLDFQALEFREFDPSKHVVPDFEIPEDYPYAEICDPSYTRGFYLIWGVIDPDDDLYVVRAEHVMESSFGGACARIKYIRDTTFGRHPSLAVMDKRGGGHATNIQAQRDWFREFQDFGIEYEPSVEYKLGSLHDALRVVWSPKKQRATPRLRFTESVAAIPRGPTWAFQNFIWGERAGKEKHKLEQQPGKDWIDVCKYFVGHPTAHYSILQDRRAQESAHRAATSYQIGPRRGAMVQLQRAYPPMREPRSGLGLRGFRSRGGRSGYR